MEWFLVIGLILFGVILIIAEIIFVPGTTVVGILGFIFSVYGIYRGYDSFGSTIGTFILVGALVLNAGAIIWSFKSKSWERLSLKDVISGKVNQVDENIQVGSLGKTKSSLKPVGKAIFEEKIVEVYSKGSFIKENVDIEVVKIDSSKIYVEPIKQLI